MLRCPRPRPARPGHTAALRQTARPRARTARAATARPCCPPHGPASSFERAAQARHAHRQLQRLLCSSPCCGAGSRPACSPQSPKPRASRWQLTPPACPPARLHGCRARCVCCSCGRARVQRHWPRWTSRRPTSPRTHSRSSQRGRHGPRPALLPSRDPALPQALAAPGWPWAGPLAGYTHPASPTKPLSLQQHCGAFKLPALGSEPTRRAKNLSIA